jgi:hypothetical protein
MRFAAFARLERVILSTPFLSAALGAMWMQRDDPPLCRRRSIPASARRAALRDGEAEGEADPRAAGTGLNVSGGGGCRRGPATGPVCPSGTASTPLRLTTGFQSGSGGDILVGKEFTCDDGSGSFLLLLRVKITFEPFSDAFTWSVLSGTGAYEKLHGSDSGFGTPIPDLQLDTFTGGIHID